MLVLGLKLTHDGALALIENGKLEFCIEIEKTKNNLRHACIPDLSLIPEILLTNGIAMDQVDYIAVDGWHGEGEFWSGPANIQISNGGLDTRIQVAAYNEKSLDEDILKATYFQSKLPLNGKKYNYSTFMHVAGHIASAYCSSPFASNHESAFVLVWDGGQYPRLYYFDCEHNSVVNLGHLFGFLGTIYSIFPQYFGPYKKPLELLQRERRDKTIEGYFGGYSIAGKIMAYIALGVVKKELFKLFANVYRQTFTLSNEFEHTFSRTIKEVIEKGPVPYKDEDVLATFHAYLQELLVSTLAEKIRKYPSLHRHLCFVGGSALNIKWNSAIRNSSLFDQVFIPPFPNDSGSAIGVACCEYLLRTGKSTVAWNTYCGPSLETTRVMNGKWFQKECEPADLASVLFHTGEPVVVLRQRAELGPRALGNRSILAPAVNPRMKDLLNDLKGRERYRPVAPICLANDAPEIFSPGCCDPFMLFEHEVRTEWKDRVPAITHLDGTARLQTVERDQNPEIYELLVAYKKLSGMALLCNTSANFNGKGFFPDVTSALEWNRVNYVWSNSVLYSRKNKIDFAPYLQTKRV